MTSSLRRALVLLPIVSVVALAQGTQAAKLRVKPTNAVQDTTAGFVVREIYSYSSAGRRDPFVSLMSTGELRPFLADLSLLGVIYDTETPRRSVAILADGSNGQTYRVMVGTVLGRMKVAKIGQQDITFAVDEFGMSRQQVLVMDKTPKKDANGSTPRRPQ